MGVTHSGVDVQDREDVRGVPLDKAGIKGLKIPLIISDKGKGQRVSATVDLFSSLSEGKKGVHLSRFMDAIRDFSERALTLKGVEEMLQKIQQGERADVEIAFTCFLLKESPVTREKSYLDYPCKIIGKRGEKSEILIQVSVPMMTSCPDGKFLTSCATHSQRGIVTVAAKGDVWFEDLIALVEKSGTELYQVLKKPDDKFIMEKAYQNPQFAEDLIRDVVVSLRKDPRIKEFTVSVENMESNHNYNAYAFVKEGVK